MTKNVPRRIARHIKQRNLLEELTDEKWEAIKRKYNYRCLRCGCTGIKLTVDHIVPISRGGLNTIRNVQPLCKKCNEQKADAIIDYRNTRKDAR